MNSNKKRGLKAVLGFDPEDKEIFSFMWYEDRDPPPLIKPKIKKKKRGKTESS